jgi:hypothetical protein
MSTRAASARITLPNETAPRISPTTSRRSASSTVRPVRSPFVELLDALAGALGALDADWYLFGAQAALIHGAARLTADVDVTVNLRGKDAKALVKALSAAGFQMRVDGDDFIERTRVLPVLHTTTGIPADIVLAGPGIEELFLKRAEVRDIDGVRVPVACAEDVMVMKILAGRPKDIEDVVAILAAHPKDLDLGLVRSTLRLLEEALGQSDLLPALERAIERARGQVTPAGHEPQRAAAPKRKRKRRSR